MAMYPATPLIIGGNECAALDGAEFDVIAPATEQSIGTAARAATADVDLAVAAARDGFVAWRALAPGAREAVLLRAADIVAERGHQRLLDLLIDESGSTINKARGEVSYTVDLLRTAAGEVRRLYGDTFPNDRSDRISMVFREPIGVVAVVSPYNASLALMAKMSAFPLAAGNAVVVKTVGGNADGRDRVCAHPRRGRNAARRCQRRHRLCARLWRAAGNASGR